MKSKRITKVVAVLMLSAVILSGGGNFTNMITDTPTTVYAAAGMQTSMGIISAKIKYSDSDIPDGVTLEQLKAKSISINPKDNPEYFMINPNSNTNVFKISAMNLTDKIYHYGFYDEKWGVQSDFFIKVTSMKKSGANGKVVKYSTGVNFLDGGEAYIVRNVEDEIYDTTAYNFLVEEEKGETNPVPPVTPPVTPPTAKSYTKARLSGNDRYGTALAIAKEFNGAKLDNVIISAGNNFPDSLSGSVLASKYNAPILLVGDKAQSASTISYIKANLKSNGKIYILGGTGVVTNEVVNSLKAQGFNNFERLGGLNRIDTNLQIVNELNVATGTNIVISSANGFADSLSVSSIASVKGMPIMLVQDTLESKTIAAIQKIKPNNIFIVGGTGAVSASIENQLKNYGSVTRIGGLNRYETSVNIAKYFKPNTTVAAVATGTNFADALAGSTLAAKYNAPIILVDDNVTIQKKYIDSTSISKLYILGGTGVVSDSMASQLIK